MIPVVAIAGSAEAGRAYDPPLRDAEAAAAAAAELGAELAAQGCHIVVHSSDPDFLECHVVRGYVGSGHARPGSVHMRGRYGTDADFEESRLHPAVFTGAREPTADWEVTYYRSLLSADALLLLGGGRSTFVAGIIGLSRRIPIAPVPTFGGSAEKVWIRFNSERSIATEEEVAVLAHPWREGSAKAIVAGLVAQLRRKADQARAEHRAERTARRRAVSGLVVALMLLVLSLALIPLAYATPAGAWQGTAVLVAAPLLASTWGAVIRNAYDAGGHWLRAAALGSAAGVISFLLFVAAQLATNPDLLAGDGPRQLVFFVLAIGFIGGFTSETVYARLRAQDVAEPAALHR
jgi:hypothetical protein